MDVARELSSLLETGSDLSADSRPIRLRLFHQNKQSGNILLPQSISGTEAVCGGFRYQVDCVATSCKLPLKDFIGLPATLEFVNDRGQLHQKSGIVAQASSGESDGAVSSYRIVICDAMTIMEQRINTRVFRRLSWPQIVIVVLKEWLQIHGALAGAFDYEFADGFRLENYSEREQTVQFNESDAAFVRRLLGRSGIAWFFRSGGSRAMQHNRRASETMAIHTIVLFDARSSLARNDSGVVRYHRDDATEQRDSITRWGAVRKLQAGSVSVFSWDYKQPASAPLMLVEAPGKIDQGRSGNRLAGGLQEYIVESPHVATNNDELYRLGLLRMQRKELDAKCFVGEGTVRDFRVGEYFTITNHPEIDGHRVADRDFVITALDIRARNNLPRSLEERVQRLFANNGGGRIKKAGMVESGTRILSRCDSRRSGVPFRLSRHSIRGSICAIPVFRLHSWWAKKTRPFIVMNMVASRSGFQQHARPIISTRAAPARRIRTRIQPG